ncbi:hypothetical protein [Methanobacterium sp. BAmetb5]|uniref:hypothetical protein n=1 Tax=Methanobacterium sp. BAmetb5 TaxID=2025351 RepID=UPI000E7E9969|nr:hypothetical protein [Methanobacterium sp. BAmetb5]AXV40385.1 MAG: hypothetical protein CIT02_08665 [Methanobacterium sp. BAmetb5]
MVKKIELNNSNMPALVDEEDYEWLNQFEWEAIELEDGVHAVRRVIYGDGTYQWILMEDMIMGID